MKMTPTKIILLFLVLGCWASAQNTLLCFQCTTSNATDGCVTDLVGMINSSLGLTKKYTKNCTALKNNATRCMILYKEKEGKMLFYGRDCHNGTYFPDEFNSPLFDNAAPNNQTTCDIVKNTVVCYRACTTSFCNGPSPSLCDFKRYNRTIHKEEEDDYYSYGEDETCGAAEMYRLNGPWTTITICLLIALALIGLDQVT